MDDDLKQLVADGYDRIAQRYLEFTQRDVTEEQSSARISWLAMYHLVFEVL